MPIAHKTHPSWFALMGNYQKYRCWCRFEKNIWSMQVLSFLEADIFHFSSCPCSNKKQISLILISLPICSKLRKSLDLRAPEYIKTHFIAVLKKVKTGNKRRVLQNNQSKFQRKKGFGNQGSERYFFITCPHLTNKLNFNYS